MTTWLSGLLRIDLQHTCIAERNTQSCIPVEAQKDAQAGILATRCIRVGYNAQSMASPTMLLVVCFVVEQRANRGLARRKR